MTEDSIRKIVRNEIIKAQIKENNRYYVPIAISNRHVHLSEIDVERLFGKGYVLKQIKILSQPGQFVCDEKISLVGPKGAIHGIRVLGPVRKETQLEISVTDSFALGIKPIVRMSGELDGTPGGKLIGPKGEIDISKGVIVSARHLHISNEEAQWYGLKNGDVVKVRKVGDREVVFGNVIVRAGDVHSLEVHIDTDEGNAAGIRCGELVLLEK